MARTWFDKVLEASEDEVDEVIQRAVDTKDAMGITDVNMADTSLGSNLSDDPYKLVYDKDYYGDENLGNEKLAGTVDNSPVDDAVTHTVVNSGNQISASEATLSADELRILYSECVAELIRESKVTLNEKFDAKVGRAKKWKAKKLIEKKARAKADRECYGESADDLNDAISKCFDRFMD